MTFLKNKDNKLITDSATQALYLLFKSIKESKLIILHPNTCLHVYMAAIKSNKKILFVDIDPITCNFKKNELEKAIIDINKVYSSPPIVVIVHLFGISCPIEVINTCIKHKSIIIEDCAQSLFSYYSNNEPVGEKGDYAVFSFGPTKHLNLKSGGAIQFNKTHLIDKVKKDLYSIRSKFIYKKLINKQYRSKYYNFMEDKICHKLKKNQNNKFIDFLKEYSNFFTEGIPKTNYNYEDIEEEIKKKYKLLDKYFIRDKLIKTELKGLPINFLDNKNKFVFWRYSFLVKKEVRDGLISHIRKHHPNLSSWYPSIPRMLSIKEYEKYTGSIELANRICNLNCNNLSDATIKKVIELIKVFLK